MSVKKALAAFAAVVVVIGLITWLRSARSGADQPSSLATSHNSATGSTSRWRTPDGKPDVKRLEALAKYTVRHSKLLTMVSLPDVIALDDKYPGFYDQFRPAIDTNPYIRREARRCNFMLPKDTTDVDFTVGLTFSLVAEGTYGLTAVSIASEGALPDDYVDCIRQSYIDVSPQLAVANAPEVIQVRTGVRMYFNYNSTPGEFKEFIAKMHDELAEVQDESLRQVYVDQINFFECVERVGQDNSKECL